MSDQDSRRLRLRESRAQSAQVTPNGTVPPGGEPWRCASEKRSAEAAADVIVALATPPGPGAIGVVRLSGAGGGALARSLLKVPEPWPERRAVLAWACDGERRLDRVLATRFPAGASYTGEELVEISAHGSPYVLSRLLELCRRAGARPALPGEFTQRAFLNGRLDLAQAEAVCDLIAARTRESHRAAVAQLEGGLSRRLGSLRARLLDLLAWAEASLDHPDEDIPLLPAEEAAARMGALREELAFLIRGRERGRLAREGARVAIVGRPNAGKSSLLNALLGRDRAIVSETAGTTRDVLEESADLGGLSAVLIDTAGLRPDPSDPVEREGQERALAALRSARLALAVLDRTEPPEAHRGLLEDLARLGEGVPCIAVLNKSDLPARTTPEQVRGGTVQISALTGAGIDELLARVRAAAAPEAGDDAPALSERHAQALEEASAELEAAAALLPVDELTASRLGRAIRALDRITGRDAGEDVLSEIFSRFCVGK